MARNILKNPRAELAAICDNNSNNIRNFKQAAGAQCREHRAFEEALKENIDAVVIASPNGLHAEMCVQAAKAKKHIYCEKPMALNVADCRRVREAVERAGVKYLIGYHRRLNLQQAIWSRNGQNGRKLGPYKPVAFCGFAKFTVRIRRHPKTSECVGAFPCTLCHSLGRSRP